MTTALVTGAASGIGRSLAERLKERGCDITLVDIDEASLERTAKDLGTHQFEVVDVADVHAMQTLAEHLGRVDLVFLNAGVVSTSTGPPWEATPAEWQRVLGVNLLGVINGLRSFVPLLLDKDESGHIVITASLAGALTWPGGGPYAASKHAVLAVAEQAALHLADTNVSVSVICPALVRTGMSDVGDDPVKIADLAIDAVENDRFAVLPDAWSGALHRRTEILSTGERPSVPSPD